MIRQMLAAALVAFQPFPGGSSHSGTAPVSPSVMATEIGSVDAAGRGTLQLLILWRGSPGWFLKDGGSSSSGGSMGGGSSTVYTHSISEGGVNLTLRFEPATSKVWIQDVEVALGDANAVLVDGVDSPTGPYVVRTLRIDAEYETTMEPPPYAVPGRGMRMRPRPVPVQTFIRRSSELIEFLQCDAPWPGLRSYEQKMFDSMCAFVRQP